MTIKPGDAVMTPYGLAEVCRELQPFPFHDQVWCKHMDGVVRWYSRKNVRPLVERAPDTGLAERVRAWAERRLMLCHIFREQHDELLALLNAEPAEKPAQQSVQNEALLDLIQNEPPEATLPIGHYTRPSVRQWVREEYEWRGEDGEAYTLTEWEESLVEDAIRGWMDAQAGLDAEPAEEPAPPVTREELADVLDEVVDAIESGNADLLQSKMFRLRTQEQSND